MTVGFRSIDVSKIQFSHDDIHAAQSVVILRTRNVKKGKITHTLPKIDRCCKSSGWDHDANQLVCDVDDKTERIFCNISKKSFKQNYVNRRKYVIIQNCTDPWKAKDWTFKGKINTSKPKVNYTFKNCFKLMLEELDLI